VRLLLDVAELAREEEGGMGWKTIVEKILEVFLPGITSFAMTSSTEMNKLRYVLVDTIIPSLSPRVCVPLLPLSPAAPLGGIISMISDWVRWDMLGPSDAEKTIEGMKEKHLGAITDKLADPGTTLAAKAQILSFIASLCQTLPYSVAAGLFSGTALFVAMAKCLRETVNGVKVTELAMLMGREEGGGEGGELGRERTIVCEVVGVMNVFMPMILDKLDDDEVYEGKASKDLKSEVLSVVEVLLGSGQELAEETEIALEKLEELLK